MTLGSTSDDEVCLQDRGDASLVRQPFDALAATPHPWTPPITLDRGRYLLHEPIGRSAVTIVWSAWDRHFGRLVALKLPAPGLQRDPLRLRALLDQAASAAFVVSEHVLRVHHVGRCPTSGLTYIDVELCAEFGEGRRRLGRSLRATPPRDVAEAVRWVMQAADAMSVAHAHGVYHRALTCSAILVRPESRRAQVTDLEIADLERFGRQRGGVPADEHDRRVREDVRRLGAILYGLLTGDLPPDHDEHAEVATDPRGRYAMNSRTFGHLHKPPRGFPRLPRLERIVRKAMETTPAARYASCAALADDLARFLRQEPTSVDAGRTLSRLALSLRRNWRPISVVISLAVSAAGLAGYEWTRIEASRVQQQIAASAAQLQRSRAELRRVRSELRALSSQSATSLPGAARE